MRAEEIFLAAVEQKSPGQRATFLDEACGGDGDLRARVDGLLQAHDGAGSFLEHSLLDVTAAGETPAAAEKPGTVIGPYKLLEAIGEGGFGVVFMAEQTKPIRRRVALKVLKPGMDSKQILARFHVERQALALMEHPNIAHVLDAGETTSGRPYFVMELVRGIPITDFCDQDQLAIEARLELFISVCQAVQHAHQKGIIHRDLKPSNVMVTLHDGKAVVKVIDFGIAKATGQRLSDKTLFTNFAQMIGTPLYMSPEQAALSGLDVDTRSDIYSLGVLLYELLTGTTPFDRERLHQVGYDELRRIIREEEPPRPSTRISTLGQAAATVSMQRRSDPRRLSQLCRGDLDWIVMKALEKDRNRRYESAGDFAADVQRYLRDEPVQACPPSAWYRIRKYGRRHKGRLAMVAGLFLVALALAATIGWGLRDRALREAEMELAETGRLATLESQVRQSYQAAQTWLAANNASRAQQHLEAARARLGADRTRLAALAGQIDAADAELDRYLRFYQLIDRAREAESGPILEAALDEGGPEQAARTSPSLGGLRPAAAVPFLRAALRSYAILERKDWHTTLDAGLLGREQVRLFRLRVYEMLLLLAVDALKRREDHSSRAKLSSQAAGRQALAYLEGAATAHEPTLAFYSIRCRCREALGEDEAAEADRQFAQRTPPTVALDHYFRGKAAYEARQLTEAVQAFEAALRLEPTHHWSLMQLGFCLCDLGQKDEDFAAAVVAFSGCILNRPHEAYAYFCRAAAYSKLRRLDDAVADLSRSIELRPQWSVAWTSRGNAKRRVGQLEEAIRNYSKAIELDPRLAKAWYNRGRVHFALRHLEESLADCSRAVELDANDANAWNHRGVAYYALGKKVEALADYDRAIDRDPELAVAWYNRGRVFADRKEFDKALAQFSQAIKLEPKNAGAWNNRGNVRRKLGDKDQALADYTRAIELDGTIAQPWYNRGDLLLNMGRPAEALPDLDQAIKRDPSTAPAWISRGNAYRLLNQLDKALVDCDKAVELDPKNADARNSRGVTYSRLSQLDKALDDLDKAIELDPKHAKAWHNRGALWLDKRKPEKALADLDEAVKLDPKTAGAWNSRGIAHRRLGKGNEALADYNRAIELDEKLATAWFNRGLLHYYAASFEPARADLTRAMELKWPTATEWLAWLLAMCPDPAFREPERAVKLAKQAVASTPKSGKCWHTLACAHYRAGDWMLAVAAMDRVKELAQPGDGLLVLAMAQWQLGNKEDARRSYDAAVKYIDKNHPNDMELRRLRAEAAELLGVK